MYQAQVQYPEEKVETAWTREMGQHHYGTIDLDPEGQGIEYAGIRFEFWIDESDWEPRFELSGGTYLFGFGRPIPQTVMNALGTVYRAQVLDAIYREIFRQ